MAFVTDNAFEIELNKLLELAEVTKREQTILFSTFAQLPHKDKVAAIKKVTGAHKQIQKFIDKAKQQEIFNSGIKFKLENLKNKLALLYTVWRKIENKT